MTRAANLAKIVTDANLEGTVDVAGAFTSLGIDDNADANAITIDSSEQIGIGTTAPSQLLHLKSTTNAKPNLLIETENAGANGGRLDFLHKSSSPADGDLLGDITFGGYSDDGTPPSDFARYVMMKAFASDVSNNAEKGKLVFSLHNGASNENNVDVMTINGDKVGISNSAPPNPLTIGDGSANITDHDLAAANSGQDAIFIASSDETAADGAKGNSIGFAAPDGHTNRHASICAVQTGSDRDQVGLAFHVHTSTSQSDAMVEACRVTSDGDLLIGKTSTAIGTEGHRITSTAASFVRDGGGALLVNRLSDDGNLVEFYGQGTHVGTIGAFGSRVHIASTGNSGIRFRNDLNCITPCNADGSNSDNDQNLGQASVRYTQIFATNNSINTSDRNEKQDIEELTDAEKRVAVACKGLMRKYRWKDAVASKGDKARTHFGIIAQDLQDAFTAESLDASKYAMFCSDTWWEKEISVDAVEADDEKGIEAKDAYTYIDDKQEATDGYTEKTRLGVRYSELLAFIISAI